MNKQFLAIIIVVVVALVGVFSLTNNKSGGNDKTAASQATTHTVGKGTKGVTLIEYGDFQCPACKSYFPLVQELKKSYGDDITFQFRHYPLNTIHPNAFIGSRAAEAAGKQGKFFEMHDLLYENQEAWSAGGNPTEVLNGYAGQLGLNVDQFKTDMMSAATAATINADIKEGQAAGANSTPTFVLQGKKIEENPRSIDDFKKLIDEAIKNASN